MISLDFLEKVEVFQDLDDGQLAAVQTCCQEAEFRRGDMLFAAGEKTTCLWVVVEGQVHLREESQEASDLMGGAISSLSEGLVFGWSSLVRPHKYRLSAHCASRSCKVLKIDQGYLTKHFEKDAKMGYAVMSRLLSIIGSRFYQLQDEVIRRRGEEAMTRW